MKDVWIKSDLTYKQRFYISLLASGLSTLEIAKREKKSHHTIRNTIAKAKERIGATSTYNLIATAVHKKWIVVEDQELPCVFKTDD